MTSAADVIAIVLGVVALLISVLAYMQSRPSAQLRRDQEAAMHTLASEALVTFDLLQTVIPLIVANANPDPYLLGVMQAQARHLQEAMGGAIRLRLWNEVVGVRPHSLSMYTAFVGGLISAAEPGAGTDAWQKQHFTMGIVRVITLCDDYHRSLKGDPLGPLLAAKVDNFGRVRDECWRYLETAGEAAPVV